MSTPFYKSATFWVAAAGFVAYVYKFFLPSTTLTADQILSVFYFLLGLVGIYPTILAAFRKQALPAGVPPILGDKNFWIMLVGLADMIIVNFLPTFPLNDTEVLAVLFFILGFFGITPELRLRALLAAPAMKAKEAKG